MARNDGMDRDDRQQRTAGGLGRTRRYQGDRAEYRMDRQEGVDLGYGRGPADGRQGGRVGGQSWMYQDLREGNDRDRRGSRGDGYETSQGGSGGEDGATSLGRGLQLDRDQGDADRTAGRVRGYVGQEGGYAGIRMRPAGGFERGYQGFGPHAGKGPRNWRSDDRVHEDVADALTADPEVDATHIVVAVKDGEVTLTGTVTDRYQKRTASDICWDVEGVEDVQNQLRIGDSSVRGVEIHGDVTPDEDDTAGGRRKRPSRG